MKNTEIDMPKVALGSVVDTALKWLTPSQPASVGTQSIGIKSMKFMRKIHMNTVSASGAISSFLAVKEPRTLLSMNSITHSTKFCMPLGTPGAGLFATRLKKNRNTVPSTKDTSKVSTLNAQKPMALASSAVCAQWKCPCCRLQVRFCRWCLIYSDEVMASLDIFTLLFHVLREPGSKPSGPL